MKKLNYPLILGIIIILFIMVVCAYPEIFSPSDPYGVERAEFVFIEGKINLFRPPVEPCAEYPWGTDVNGRDMRSLIFYGCRLTLFTAIFIAFGRLIISLPLAILAGYKNKFSTWLIKQFNIVFSAFPLIIITLLITRIKLVEDLFGEPTVIVSYILIAFGWSKLANLLKERVEEILSQDFIEGEIAIGKNRLEIAVQNIIPHLIPSIVVLFFLEIASALLILSQIGVFGVVFGGGLINADGDFQMPLEIDWASLLSAAQWFISIGKYWLVMYPAVAFSISIIGFNLLGEGLRLEFDKRSSRIITWIRGIPSFLSPIRLAYEMKHINEYRRSVRRKFAFYLIVLLIIFFPQGKSLYKFDYISAFNTMNELSDLKYEGRRSGSGKNDKIAEDIAEKLRSYNVQPFNGSYLCEYDMESAFNIKDSSLVVSSEVSGSTELVFRKDYQIMTPNAIRGTYDVEYVNFKDLIKYPLHEEDYLPLRDKVLLIDVRGMNDIMFSRFVGFINNTVRPIALMYISEWESEDIARKATTDRLANIKDPILNISLAADKGDKLLRKSDMKVSINVDYDSYADPKSKSVVGIIPGSDEELKNEIIIVGSSFDGVGDDLNVRYPGSMETGGTAIELEIAKVLGSSKVRPKRTVVFGFWDAAYTGDKGIKYFVDQNFKKIDDKSNRKVFYLDLKGFGNQKAKKIIIDTTNTLPKDYLAQKYIKTLKKHARRNDVKLVYGKVNSLATFDLLRQNINSVIVDSRGIEDELKTQYDNVDNLDKKRLKAPGQMLIDTVYEIACGGTK